MSARPRQTSSERLEAAEVSKYKNGYENANKEVVDFVATTKEKAKEAFADGFCLARKHILDRNPEVDLTELNGLVHSARSAEWFSPAFWKLTSLDVASSPQGSARSIRPVYFCLLFCNDFVKVFS